MVTHSYKPSTQEAKARGLLVLSQPGLQRVQGQFTLPQIIKNFNDTRAFNSSKHGACNYTGHILAWVPLSRVPRSCIAVVTLMVADGVLPSGRCEHRKKWSSRPSPGCCQHRTALHCVFLTAKGFRRQKRNRNQGLTTASNNRTCRLDEGPLFLSIAFKDSFNWGNSLSSSFHP